MDRGEMSSVPAIAQRSKRKSGTVCYGHGLPEQLRKDGAISRCEVANTAERPV